jgi:hypothetical protein
MAVDLVPPRVALQSAMGSAVAPLASQEVVTHASCSPDLSAGMGPVLVPVHVIMQVIMEDLWA